MEEEDSCFLLHTAFPKVSLRKWNYQVCRALKGRLLEGQKKEWFRKQIPPKPNWSGKPEGPLI